MKRWCCALLIAAAVSGKANAQDSGCERRAGVPLALGFSVAEELREEYGSATRAVFVPELLVLGYVPLSSRRLYLRPGLRVGYDGLGQAEMPRAAQVRERTLYQSLEIGLLLDWIVVPAFSLGGGVGERFISLHTAGAVSGTRALDHTETLASIYAALGLGIPLARGLFVIEPYVRVQHVWGDDRSTFRLGIDTTIRL